VTGRIFFPSGGGAGRLFDLEQWAIKIDESASERAAIECQSHCRLNARAEFFALLSDGVESARQNITERMRKK